MEISVIIPTLNEELLILKTLEAVSRLQNVSEIVVVDGGSTDNTAGIVENFQYIKPLKLISASSPGRGKQLHEGTLHATGNIFWFIHADTRPVQGCARQIKGVMKYSEVAGGNFEIIFSGDSRWAKFLTWLYPHLRSIGLVYGDSAMFVSKEAYEKAGGFRDYPLFEDVDIYKRLQRVGRFVHLSQSVTASSRRFEGRSFLLTFAKWSVLQGLYWFGASPKFLSKYYLPERNSG